MWDGLLLLVLLCIVMAASSFLFGMLPLYFSLSSRQLRMISALGTGVLVGVALIIIIPEGVETLYNASGRGSESHSARSIAVSMKAGRSLPVVPAAMVNELRTLDDEDAVPTYTGFVTSEDDGAAFSVEEATAAQEWERQQQHDDQGSDAVSDETQEEDMADESPRDPHIWVGLSLISGFILMYLIDTIPRRTSSRPERTHVSLNNLNFNNRSPTTPTEAESGENLGAPVSTQPGASNTSRPSSTTTGLVIHGCADGIALGASSTTTSSLTFVIFIALIVHKAPAAFGLTSVLLKQGLSKRMARTHLIVFSLAAPVGALVAWASAHLLGYSTSSMQSSMSTEFATGVLLLFSGGTFLYVATHTMQDAGHGHGEETRANGYRGLSMSDVYETNSAAATKGNERNSGLRETGLTVLGMLVPLLFQFGHGR